MAMKNSKLIMKNLKFNSGTPLLHDQLSYLVLILFT